MIAVLSVKAENIFNGSEVTGFVVVSSSILNVVMAELVAPGSCDGCVATGDATLESVVHRCRVRVSHHRVP